VAALIAAQREDHQIPCVVACRALGVSRSWFYKWKAGTLPPRAERRERLAAEVARLFMLHGGKYGSPRITADLREEGWRVSENTVAALMREQHLAARRKKKRKSTTRPGRGRWRAPDLVQRDFPAAALNRKWFGDGTQILTDEGRLHLVSVLDVASRRVLGFALGERHDAALAYGALAMAIAARGGQVPGVVFHTDQGSEGGIHGPVLPGCLPAAPRHPVHGPARVRAGQRGDRILALHAGVRTPLGRALRHQDSGPGQGRGLDRGLQHLPPALRLPDDVPGGLRKDTGGLRCPRFSRLPRCASARSCPGRSSAGLTALAGAPPGQALRSGALIGQRRTGTKTRSAQIRVSTV
jgi:transposase InsO family protein